MPDLAIIIPTRGRPENIRKVIAAWDFTGAWADADMILAVDANDPEIRGYRSVLAGAEHRQALYPGGVMLAEYSAWQPMVPKLNTTALGLALGNRDYRALGFAGDDHLPRTIGWAGRYLAVLDELGTGMVYGDDGYQGIKLSTEWAVTADVVRALGGMVPAPVDHLYCDNAMMDLFGGAGALRHLPEIRIEHMHPVAGKAASDAQYDRVNGSVQYRDDRAKYESWKSSVLSEQIAKVRGLRAGRPDEKAPRVIRAQSERSGAVRGSGPRKVERSGPSRFSAPPKSRFPFPREFRNVIGATPDEIAFTLADLAKQVPADQEIVELGVYQGRTAIIMAWGAAQGNGAHVTAVDAWDLPGNTYHPPFTDPATRETAQANVGNLGYAKRIWLMHAFASEVGQHWGNPDVGNRKQVGLLFVDDDHSEKGARDAITSWIPHLHRDAVIAVDDYGHPDWPGVKLAVDALVEEGVLRTPEIFHERLAVTKILARPINGGAITAITSEGVEFLAPEPETMPEPDPASVDLNTLTDAELRERAKQKGLPTAGRAGARELLIKRLSSPEALG